MTYISHKDEDDVRAWFRRQRGRMPYVSWKCLVWHHRAGRWKQERNRQWMLDILEAMVGIRNREFYGARQKLLARNYPRPA